MTTLPPSSQNPVIANGLQLQTIEIHTIPIVTVALMIRSGSDQDPLQHAGLSHLTATSIDTGTPTFDIHALAEQTEFLGTSLHISATHDGASIVCSTLRRHLDGVMGTISEILCHAAFPEHEVNRLRATQITSLLQIRDRPSLRAAQTVDQILFGSEHCYGRPTLGEQSNLSGLTAADTSAFFRDRYRPSGAVAVAAGDITIEDWINTCERHFACWEGTPPAPLVQPALQRKHTRTVYLIDRPSTPQAEIRMGCLALERRHPEYLAATVLNHCLGGQFSSRLNKTLREERGLTYGVWSSFSALRTAGSFVQGGAFQTEKAGEALQGLTDEVERIVGEGITEEELRSAQRSMSGNFLRASELATQLAGRRQAMYLFDLPEEYYATYIERLNALSRPDILRAAQHWLRPEEMVTAVVGDAHRLRGNLEALHLGEVRDYLED
jgi:zinc protease